MPHIHDQYDFVVTAYVVFENRVLLVNHPRYGKWIPVGGHIELDEDPDDALMREVKEETGLTVELLSPKPHIDSAGTKFLTTPDYMDVHEAGGNHKHIALIYIVRASNNQHVKSDEHTDMHWFTYEELSESKYALSEAVKFQAQQALHKANLSSA